MDNTRRGGKETLRLLSRTKNLYFAGICGVSMGGLAHMAKVRGWLVRGCDRSVGSPEAHALFRAGISVEPETRPDLTGVDAVIYSAAIRQESPAIRLANEAGIPLISRADFLAALMEASPTRIVVAGMHGKSTTVGMLTAILEAAGLFPTVAGGAPLTPGDDAYRIGAGQIFLAEGCEYRDSFLSLSPTLAVVTNIDHDHPDYFPDLGAVKSSFFTFLTSSGKCILGGDCAHLTDIAPGGAVYFGYAPFCQIRGQDKDGGMEVLKDGESLGYLSLALAGRYNRENALAATAAALELGIPFSQIQAALASFRGVGRRMEYKGIFQGAKVYLDYAHHPTEIAAALTGIKEDAGRVLCVYQPHTFTRTQALWEDFCTVLGLADATLLLDIYPAREASLPGVTSQRLAEDAGVAYAPDFAQAVSWMEKAVRPGDTLLLMGAGDVDRLADMIPLQ